MTGRDVLHKYDIRPKKMALGSVYGGWTIAPEELKADSTVYSFGVGNDISFDLELISRFGLKVHGFDPSPESIAWIAGQKLPPQYTFHPYGLGVADGGQTFFAPSKGGMYSQRQELKGASAARIVLPTKRLATIIRCIGTRCIDVLKMDIEGAEYGVLSDLIECSASIRQLLVEFHHRAGIESLEKTVESVNRLKSAGFQLFHVSETSSEFSFLQSSAEWDSSKREHRRDREGLLI